MRYLMMFLLLCGVASAQLDTAPTSMVTSAKVRVRGSFVPGPGFAIPARLQTAVGAKTKVDTPVVFRVAEDVTDNGRADGRVLIPKDARILGRVVEAERRQGAEKESRLAILVERAEWSGGKSARLSGYVAAIYKMPDVEVSQKAKRDVNPNVVETQEQVGRTYAIHPHLQNEASPGQLDPCYERGCGVDVFNDKDVRLMSMEDVELETDPVHGSVLVSKKHDVNLEKWTFLVLRTNGILLGQKE